MCNQLLAMMFGQFLNTIANYHRKYSIITIYHNIDYVYLLNLLSIFAALNKKMVHIMSKVRKSYNKATKSYTFSLTGLSKYQFQSILTMFRNLCPQCVIGNYQNGLTLPFIECTTFLPLSASRSNFLVANYNELSELFDRLGNTDIPTRNVIYDEFGNKISRI